MDIETERAHMREAVQIFRELTGSAPLGWYTGRDSPNTRQLVVEHGGFAYDSDYYGDDLPFWTEVETSDGTKAPHLVVPYTLDSNDMRFATPQGFNTSEHFYQYLKDSFDVLYEEGEEAPKMLSIGMHCRLLGRPGRFRALQRFWIMCSHMTRSGSAGGLISLSTGRRRIRFPNADLFFLELVCAALGLCPWAVFLCRRWFCGLG
jgi:peptidoglycan/xylan/chitin deacetylase (PgdA/CDA1 family)